MSEHPSPVDEEGAGVARNPSPRKTPPVGGERAAEPVQGTADSETA
jgi:hypothetical protein